MDARVTRPFAALSATLVVAAVVLSACGGGDAKASGTPSAPTTSATSSPSPTKTETTPPLSRFEDQPPVQAARRWVELSGRAIQHHEKSYRSVRPVTTPAGLAVTKKAWVGDMSHGYRWPGPEPFTPTRVDVNGDTAKVIGCWQYSGWSIDPKTHKRIGKRRIVPFVIVLSRVHGQWKFANILSGAVDCRGVKVVGVKW